MGLKKGIYRERGGQLGTTPRYKAGCFISVFISQRLLSKASRSQKKKRDECL